jgi:hypothetical protein
MPSQLAPAVQPTPRRARLAAVIAAIGLLIGLWALFHAGVAQGEDSASTPEDPCVVHYGPAGCSRLVW